MQNNLPISVRNVHVLEKIGNEPCLFTRKMFPASRLFTALFYNPLVYGRPKIFI